MAPSRNYSIFFYSIQGCNLSLSHSKGRLCSAPCPLRFMFYYWLSHTNTKLQYYNISIRLNLRNCWSRLCQRNLIDQTGKKTALVRFWDKTWKIYSSAKISLRDSSFRSRDNERTTFKRLRPPSTCSSTSGKLCWQRFSFLIRQSCSVVIYMIK